MMSSSQNAFYYEINKHHPLVSVQDLVAMDLIMETTKHLKRLCPQVSFKLFYSPSLKTYKVHFSGFKGGVLVELPAGLSCEYSFNLYMVADADGWPQGLAQHIIRNITGQPAFSN